LKTKPLSFYPLIGLLLVLIIPCAQGQAPGKESPASINQRLDRIERLLQNQGLLEMLQQIETLQQEIKGLRGELELQNHTIDQLQRRQRALYTDIDQRMQNLDKPATEPGILSPATDTDTDNPPLQTLTPIFNPGQTSPAQQTNAMPGNGEIGTLAQQPGPTTAGIDDGGVMRPMRPPAQAPQSRRNQTMVPVAVPTDPAAEPGLVEPVNVNPALARAEYDQAFSLLKQAQYEQAIRAFREFLALYPASEYSDNAQYWLGEAFYVMRRFEEAITEYELLTNQYPDSQKYTHALLKIGYSYQELGMLEDTKQYLQILVNNNPGTTASRLAQERLQQIAIMEKQAAELN